MFLETISTGEHNTEKGHFNKSSVEWIINLPDKRNADCLRKDYYIKYYHALKLISQTMYTAVQFFQT